MAIEGKVEVGPVVEAFGHVDPWKLLIAKAKLQSALSSGLVTRADVYEGGSDEGYVLVLEGKDPKILSELSQQF